MHSFLCISATRGPLSPAHRYADVGARLPRGVLLSGPSGTGKTLLARAMAAEARVPFFSCSASDFVEMLVGRGGGCVRCGLFIVSRGVFWLCLVLRVHGVCVLFQRDLSAIVRAVVTSQARRYICVRRTRKIRKMHVPAWHAVGCEHRPSVLAGCLRQTYATLVET